MTTCAKTGCLAVPEVAIKVNVPAKGHAIDTHQPIGMFIGLKLCRHHGAECKISDFLSDQLKQGVRAVASGRAAPDFKRAWLSTVEIDSPEFLQFEKMANRSQ